MAGWKISGIRHSEWEIEVVWPLAPTKLFVLMYMYVYDQEKKIKIAAAVLWNFLRVI